ncbi:MAG: helix-turn-helix domain-containing protein [Clostridia bacterium]|nr:helix-turn-helix domain-containing protein [Clostridia bacterium]
MNKDEVVERISLLRTKAGLSARDLSLKIGKNTAYISRLESKNDSFEPSVSALLEIIAACGSTESEFFYYDIYAYSKDKEIIDLLNTVTPIKKDAIINLLKNK